MGIYVHIRVFRANVMSRSLALSLVYFFFSSSAFASLTCTLLIFVLVVIKFYLCFAHVA